MAAQTNAPISAAETESQILTSYLLPPSTLPTIIPLANFSTLLPAHLRPNPHPHLRALYRDLQFQRSVLLDQVRENIAREARRGQGMRARLARDVGAEIRDGEGDGDVDDGFEQGAENGRARRRQRRIVDDDEEVENDADEPAPTIKTEPADAGTTIAPSTEILLDSAMLASTHSSDSSGQLSNLPVHTSGARTQHTLPSLLSAMEAACRDLEKETEDAEAEAQRILSEMRETVGALSDLRYGRFAREGETGPEAEVVEGLKGLVGVCDS